MANKRVWETNGLTLSLYADDVLELELPLALLSAAPDTLVGRDPATGLPAYCPPPTVVETALHVDIPIPPVMTTADTCVQVRCGVAQKMTIHLLDLYLQWANWLKSALKIVAALGTVSLLAFLDGFFAPLAPEITAVWVALRPAIAVATAAFLDTAFPSLTSVQQIRLTQTVFCALTCAGDVVTPSSATVSAWRAGILADPTVWNNDLQRDLLAGLVLFTPLNDWLVAAAAATPSHACDGLVCA